MQTIYIDISNKGTIPRVFAKQGDVGRSFLAILSDNGIPYAPGDGSVVSVWYSGKSGEGNYTSIGESQAVRYEKNKIFVELITQMLSVAGDGIISLVLNDASGQQIGFWNIDYTVEPVAGIESPEATQHFTMLSETAAKIMESVDRVEGLAKEFTIDKTLSVDGAAADAAAVGEALSKVTGYGLGAGEMTVIDDANDTTLPTGWYRYTSQTPLVSGVPESLNGLLRVERYSDSFTVQTYYFMVTGMEPIRRSFCYDYALDEDIWTPWVSLGSADRVVEQGKTGIWNYRKWDSGKIELWTNSHQFTISFTTSSNGFSYATENNIPVPLVKSIEFASGDCTKWHYVNWASVTCNDELKLGIRYYGLSANGNGNTIPFSFYVIGRWK